jgi:formate/nitrite transporter FocA (FNT family)
LSRESFALALMGGTVITLMTWMERGTRSVPAKLLAAWGAAFLPAAAPPEPRHRGVVGDVRRAARGRALRLSRLGALAWAALGNLLGGVGLVTALRLVQVGRVKLEQEKRRPAEPAPGDSEGTTE